MWKARKNYEYDIISIDFDDKVDDLKIIKSNISNLLFLIYLKKLKTRRNEMMVCYTIVCKVVTC